MTTDSYKLFCNQLESVIKRFPNLKIAQIEDVKFLKGILDIENEYKEIVGSFSIEIKHSKEFPYMFPILYEVGDAISNIPDRHKYNDGSCCITVLPDEILKCKDGLSVISFIERFAIPYFANQIYYSQNNKFLNGEYGHYSKGLIEFYNGFFKTTNILKWHEDVQRVSSGSIVKMGRNKSCFCGSGLKYKNCHDKIYYNISRLGINQIINDFKNLIK